jgi:hypothetical protein
VWPGCVRSVFEGEGCRFGGGLLGPRVEEVSGIKSGDIVRPATSLIEEAGPLDDPCRWEWRSSAK